MSNKHKQNNSTVVTNVPEESNSENTAPTPKVKVKSAKPRTERPYRIAQLQDAVGRFRVFKINDKHERDHDDVNQREARAIASRHGLKIVYR